MTLAMSDFSTAYQWNSFPDIGETHSLDESDKHVMEKIRDVLSEHNKLDRFGLTLLHKHFEVAPDEILVESVNVEKRELVVSPVKLALIGSEMPSAYETQWKLSTGAAAQVCVTRCFPGSASSPNHVAQHTAG